MARVCGMRYKRRYERVTKGVELTRATCDFRGALDTLGFWPTYPGHPCTLALLILRKYPRIADAFVPAEHVFPEALGDSDIPCGSAVDAALGLIRYVRNGTLAPDAAIQWGVDHWKRDTDGVFRDRYPEGVAEEASVLPALREALAKVAPSAAAHSA